MRINFTITYADQVAFEQATDRSIARLGDDFRLTDACWLAWHALKRNGKTPKDFEAWLDAVDNVEIGQGKIVPLEETTTPTG